jgi:hypothetical protein
LKTCKAGDGFYIYNESTQKIFYITAESSQGDRTKVFQVTDRGIIAPHTLSLFLSYEAFPADVTITFTKK